MTTKRRGLKKLYNLHAWVGFQLAALMFVVLATGTIATLSNEIDWLIFPELRSSEKPISAPDSMQVEDWVGIYQSVKNTYPNSAITAMTKLDSEYLTFRVVLDEASLKNRFVQVDPWTYEVKGDIPRLTVQRFFRDFHRYLFMPALPGLLIVGPLSIILLISIYTGLKTTRNWKKSLWRVRVRQGKRVFLSDLHKFLGLWGVWFTVLMAVTGAWYLYEFGAKVVGSTVEPKSPAIEIIAERNTSPLSVEQFTQIVNKAQSAHDNWEMTGFYSPFSEKSAIQFRGVSNSNPIIRNRAHRVFIDPNSHEIIEKWSPETITTKAYINEYIDPLHFGDFGGFWLKMLWFVFGIALTMMSYTGVLMTWERTGSRALTRVQKRTLPVFALSLVVFIFWLLRFI